MSTTSKPPKYRRQTNAKGNDRAFVVIDGVRHSLGAYGSPESRDKYAVLIGKRKPTPEVQTGPATVNEVLLADLKNAEAYYRDSPGEIGSIKIIAKMLRHEAGRPPAEPFGPKRLKWV